MPWYLHLYQFAWLTLLVVVCIELGWWVALAFLYTIATIGAVFA